MVVVEQIEADVPFWLCNESVSTLYNSARIFLFYLQRLILFMAVVALLLLLAKIVKKSNCGQSPPIQIG